MDSYISRKLSAQSSALPEEWATQCGNAQRDDLLRGIEGPALGEGADDGDVVQGGNEGHHHHTNANVAHDLWEGDCLIGVGVDRGEGRQGGLGDARLDMTCQKDFMNGMR